MNVLLLIVSILLTVLYGALRNGYCKKNVTTDADLHLFNVLSNLISMIVLAVIGLCTGSLSMPSPYTLGMGLLFGIATILCALFNMKALTSGPLSYTNIIISCAMVIPALSGMVLYGETVSVWQWVGIALMLVSIVCAVDRTKKGSGASLRWLAFCMLSFLACGAVGVMQKLHQSSPHKDELGAFLVLAFAVSCLFSLYMTWHCHKIQKQPITVKLRSPRFAAFGLMTGLSVALCNQINLYLSGAMDAMIFYPVNNGACMLLTTLAGFLFWKERFTRWQWFGLVAGGCAILLLCNIL